MSSISCRICKALIDCPKEEVDAFVMAFSEHILSNSSAITALDLCHPCLNDARKKANDPITTEGTAGIRGVSPPLNFGHINVAT